MSDRGVGPAVEQLEVGALHVIGPTAVLDSQPAPGPLDVGWPGLRDPVVEPLRSPVVSALAQAVRGKEEGRLRAGQLTGATEVSLVGDADGRTVPELVLPVAVDGAADLRVAGDIDVDGRV